MKVSAIFAMGRNGHDRWWPFILKELDSTTPELQYEAVRAAGEACLEEATPQLVSLVEDTEDRTLRLEAIWALGQTGGDTAYEFLDELQFDLREDQETREVAEAALDELLMLKMYEEDTTFWDEDEEEVWGNGNGNGNGVQYEDDW
jgi:HEAT repeat protein